ncbi:hypothetical protein Enr13x_31240 [Stieleria neptunia]|uniref:Uncharacterized protein n=1 Tax=Stieleria neptunia TaxID=2527979 RepID=A0A518HR02_9BACT|nr:hypothetical protein Enr13x_31240 [Stieleria neptunia]
MGAANFLVTHFPVVLSSTTPVFLPSVFLPTLPATFRMQSCFVIDPGSLGPREFFTRCRLGTANRVVEVDVVGAHGWPPNRAGKDRSRH